MAYLSFSTTRPLRVERQLVGDRGQLLRRCDHRLCVRLELDADGWVTRLRQFFGVDDVDVPFDEHLGELALVVLRVSATRVRALDHHARVVDRQAIDDVGVGAGDDPIGARHHFRRRESPFVHQPAMNLGRLQMLLARRRGDANEFQELIPSCLGRRIGALILEQCQDLRIVGDLLRGSDDWCRNRGWGPCRRGRGGLLRRSSDDRGQKNRCRCKKRAFLVRTFHLVSEGLRNGSILRLTR